MVPQKVKSIINSCKTHAQLETCGQWVDHIFSNEDKTEAMAIIQQRTNQIEIIQFKASKEFADSVHTMD